MMLITEPLLPVAIHLEGYPNYAALWLGAIHLVAFGL